jgi:hypothetical protein
MCRTRLQICATFHRTRCFKSSVLGTSCLLASSLCHVCFYHYGNIISQWSLLFLVWFDIGCQSEDPRRCCIESFQCTRPKRCAATTTGSRNTGSMPRLPWCSPVSLQTTHWLADGWSWSVKLVSFFLFVLCSFPLCLNQRASDSDSFRLICFMTCQKLERSVLVLELMRCNLQKLIPVKKCPKPLVLDQSLIQVCLGTWKCCRLPIICLTSQLSKPNQARP